MNFQSIVFAAGLLLTGSASQASIVTNGSFESGLSGWSCVVSDGACGNDDIFGTPAGAQHFWGYQNSPPQGVLSQSLATESGETYGISFLFNSSTEEPTNTLAVLVGNLSEVLDVADFNWRTYSGTFLASGPTTNLSFQFRTVGGSGVLGVDNVVVERVSGAQVPVPATLGLVLAGLGLVGAARRSRT